MLDLLDKHHDANAFVRAGTLAWTQAQVQLRHLGITAAEASLFQRLAGHVLFADASLRPSSDAIRRGGGGPAALWSQGISGDLPIVLLRIGDVEDIAIARQLLQAHEYWRMKQLAVDLVILNERGASYVQDLQIALETLVRTSQSRGQTAAGWRARFRLHPAHGSHPGGDARRCCPPSRASCSSASAAASRISSIARAGPRRTPARALPAQGVTRGQCA